MVAHQSLAFLSLLLSCLALVCLQPVATELICVKPSISTHCNCHNFTKCNVLVHFIQNVDSSFASNVVMEFMPGTHSLESGGPIKRYNISNFTLRGQEGTAPLNPQGQPEPSASIKCSGSHLSGFYFLNSSSIRIERISIQSCGLVFVNRSTTLVRAAVALDNVVNLYVSRVSITYSRGVGFHADLVFGNVSVTDSLFQDNKGSIHYYGGNFRLWYGSCYYVPGYPVTSVTIRSSWFLYGRDYAKQSHNLFYPDATGLTVRVGCPNITVNISKITAFHNRADNGGNMAISLNFTEGSGSAVYFTDSLLTNGFSHRGGGLRVWSFTPNTSSLYPPLPANSGVHISLFLSNISFVNNSAAAAGGALYLSHFETDCHTNCRMRTVVIENCTFRANNVSAMGNGAVMQILKHKLPGFAPIVNNFDITFRQCLFDHNVIIKDDRNRTHGATIEVVSIDKITFQNCSFTNNNITALSARSSNLLFKGHTLFHSNRGINGGALKFCDSSFVYLENDTTVQFINNSASNAGGAVYAQQRCLESNPPCFFQPIIEDFTNLSAINTSLAMTMEFRNNSAVYAGDVLYGGAVDNCFTYKILLFNSTPSYYYSNFLFDTLFNFSAQEGSSKVSSDPYAVCLCDSNGTHVGFNCSQKNKTIGPIYRGEEFVIFAVTIGQRLGFAQAPIETIVVDSKGEKPNITVKRPPKQDNCVNLAYNIHTTSDSLKLNLTVQQANQETGFFYYTFDPPQITVKFRDCPWGFQLSGSYCTCHASLMKYPNYHVRCFINSQAVQREGTMWIGFDHKYFKSFQQFIEACANKTKPDPACQNVSISVQCPYDYCQVEKVNVSIDSFDRQCDFHRRGILCGQCEEGMSVVLGDSSCKHCSYISLLVLPTILFLGILLVVILSALNLTVTEGTINGLIFYANIIQVNRAIYFPGRKSSYFLQACGSVISWLNLDLGVRTCFYPGMDTYAKVWFQFLFPVYIWLIVAAIVRLSRRFSFFSRLSGENAVKVLATLFLLSMAKLGRNVIAVLADIKLHLPDGSHHTMWLPDGNIPYFSAKHIPLFFTALIFTALILGYVIVLSLVHWLQKCSWKSLFWVSKFKPFFDAHTGPYKDCVGFWTGFLLIVRVILFCFYSLSNGLNTQAKLIVTAIASCVIMVVAWMFGGVYKKRQLDVLEGTFIFNIGALSIVVCYIEGLGVSHRHEYNRTAFGVSAGVALLTFLGVIIYHVYVFTYVRNGLQRCCKTVLHRIRSCRGRRMRRQRREELFDVAETVGEKRPLITHTEVSTSNRHLAGSSAVDQESLPIEQRYPVARFDRLREPVMDFGSPSIN